MFIILLLAFGISAYFLYSQKRPLKQLLLLPVAPLYFAVLNLRHHMEQTALMSAGLTILTLIFLFSPNLFLQLILFALYFGWSSVLIYFGGVPNTGARSAIPYKKAFPPIVLNTPKKGLELLVFQTGKIETGSWGVYEGPSKPIVMDEAAFVIKHPTHGYIMYETGIHPEVSSDPVGYVGPLLYFGGFLKMEQEKHQDILSQLKKNRITLNDIKTIFVSHLHPEHGGAITSFPDTPIAVDKKEYDYAFNKPKYNYFEKEYKTVEKWKLLDFEQKNDFEPFEGAIDWFKDGSVFVISTPGHTPGHISLLLNLPQGPVFLVGDIIWKQENLSTQTIGMPFVSVDGEAHRKALGQLTKFVEVNPEVLIVPSHDLRNVKNTSRGDIKIVN